MIDELQEMLNPQTLPLLKFERRAHYEGSIDKRGANADWDWELYKTDIGECVLFEQYGPGCIYNFVQHRYIASPEPTFRFYFDGEKTPRFVIKPSQFGEKYPFIEPLAGKFIGPVLGNEIRVVRSFVPMPFRSYCRITSDIPLYGNSAPGGGWGHVVYHTYAGEEPVKSFDPKEKRYRELAQLYSQIGRNPLQAHEKQRTLSTRIRLESRGRAEILRDDQAGLVNAIRIRTAEFRKEHLLNVWVLAKWDGHPEWDVELPWGCLFSNELGHHGITYLYAGMDAEGGYYCFFPMPYLKSARIYIENRGEQPLSIDFVSVETTREYSGLYHEGNFGYFMNAPYYPKKNTHGADSLIADITGFSGHVVGSVITGYPFTEKSTADCEGDVRIHFDGIRTPQIESDGSESYSSFGWGFCSPPQSSPISGYDGKEPLVHKDWSMSRQLAGDCYPFYESLRFGIESFGNNNHDMYHSGAVLLYGNRGSIRKKLGSLTDSEETMTGFFEGDDDHIPVTLSGARRKEMVCRIPVTGIREVILRRVSDQAEGRQMASVYLDGEELAQPWYASDHNPYKRWLEDEYVIPAATYAGKETVCLRIVPRECAGRVSFNTFGLEIYGRTE